MNARHPQLERRLAVPALARAGRILLAWAALGASAAPAADIQAFTSFGDLVVNGSAQDDRIVIQMLANGSTLRITGQGGTTINGRTSADFIGFNRSMMLDLQGGNDRVTLGDLSLGLVIPGGLDVVSAEGADMVDVVNVEVSGGAIIETGNQFDFVTISYSHFQQGLDLLLGNDSDYALIQATRIDGNLSLDGGAGPRDQDILEMTDVTVGGDLSVTTGAGVDGIDLMGVTIGGTAEIDTGDHRDHVAAQKLTAGSLTVTLGGGNDLLDLRDSSVESLSLNAGEGLDTLCSFGNRIREITGRETFESLCKGEDR